MIGRSELDSVAGLALRYLIQLELLPAMGLKNNRQNSIAIFNRVHSRVEETEAVRQNLPLPSLALNWR